MTSPDSWPVSEATNYQGPAPIAASDEIIVTSGALSERHGR